MAHAMILLCHNRAKGTYTTASPRHLLALRGMRAHAVGVLATLVALALVVALVGSIACSADRPGGGRGPARAAPAPRGGGRHHRRGAARAHRLRGTEFNSANGEPAIDASLRANYGDRAGYYLVKLDPAAKANVARWREVYWVGAYPPAYRLAPGLLNANEGDFAVEFAPGAADVAALQALGLEVRSSGPARAASSTALRAC